MTNSDESATDGSVPGFATRATHAGQDADPVTNTQAPRLHQTTSYVFDDVDHAARLFALEEAGNIYSRIMNPTTGVLEERVTALEGGTGAVATASGMAALNVATFLLAAPGDNIVTAESLYGGTHTYFSHTAARRNVEARFVETLDLEAYEAAIDEQTAFVHAETIGNPALDVPDLEAIADIAHEHGCPFFVDNTFATPYLCRPFEHGADLIWHSTTKWIHGSGSTIGGILVDGGSFPWGEYPEKYPEIGGDNPAYHGVNFAERFGDSAFAVAARARGLRDLGCQQAPFDAWVTTQKLETLPQRMNAHCQNASAVAEYLLDHPKVTWVNYPGLPSHETHDHATRYLEDGYGGMVTFGLESGFEGAKRAVEATELIDLLANVGDARSVVIHPASTTHQQLSEAEQRESGVTPDLIRLSVGLEDPADIIADLDQAIDTAT